MCSLIRASGTLGDLLEQLHSTPSAAVSAEQLEVAGRIVASVSVWIGSVLPRLEGPDSDEQTEAPPFQSLSDLAFEVAHLRSRVETRLLNEWIAPSESSLGGSSASFRYDAIGKDELVQRLRHHRALREATATIAALRLELAEQLSRWEPAAVSSSSAYSQIRSRIAELVDDDPLLPAELNAVAPVLEEHSSAWSILLGAAALDGWAQTTMDLIDLHLEQITTE